MFFCPILVIIIQDIGSMAKLAIMASMYKYELYANTVSADLASISVNVGRYDIVMNKTALSGSVMRLL